MNRVLSILAIAFLTAATADAAPPCPSQLGNNVLRCSVKGEDGSQFDDCFRFATPGVVSGKFEFVSDLLGSAVGCTCKPTPRFGVTSSFQCTSTQGVSFDGKVKRKGTVSKGTIANVNGGAFIFSCQRDPACAVSQ
jgi:hypothetical protein